MTPTNDRSSHPIALITGGSRGLGKSMALHLAERGADVLLTYHSSAGEAQEVVAQIEARGRKAAALPLDVAKTSSFGAFADAVTAELARSWKRDRLDFLINNAGVGCHAPFAETTEAQFDEQVNVHFKATFFLSQKLLPLIADGGRILNMSSGLTRFSAPGYAAYGAAKGAIDVLTRYMALELGPRRITVNVIAPGGIETDFGGGALRNPEVQKYVAGQTALSRIGMPDDIGGIAAMLLSPETGWLNGQRLEATGGYNL